MRWCCFWYIVYGTGRGAPQVRSQHFLEGVSCGGREGGREGDLCTLPCGCDRDARDTQKKKGGGKKKKKKLTMLLALFGGPFLLCGTGRRRAKETLRGGKIAQEGRNAGLWGRQGLQSGWRWWGSPAGPFSEEQKSKEKKKRNHSNKRGGDRSIGRVLRVSLQQED